MIAIFFTVCELTTGACFVQQQNVPLKDMSPLYCQIRGGVEVAVQWIESHPGYQLSPGTKIVCMNGLPA
jgi:hypothetical protein